MAYQVGKDERTGEQVTVDCESGKIVEDVLKDRIVELQSGLRVRVEGGWVVDEA
jgi:hypothetical protein